MIGTLGARYSELDADSREELYQEAWAGVLKRRGEGAQIEDLEAYLVGTASNLAGKRVHGADARRRVTFDPIEGPFTALADLGASPEDSVLAADEARQVRMLVDELGVNERAVLKLHLDMGLAPAEIRERLGLSERQYRRVAERAGRALAQQCAEYASGTWGRRQRSLLGACVMGIASERQRARARELVASDPACRAMMSDLRELGGRAAAVLPLPAGPVAIEGELLAGLKEHAAAAYVRIADPTPLAGARPGAVATVVAGCIAAGGGAYCAVEGVPGSIAPALGIERPAQEPAARPAPGPAPPQADLVAPPAPAEAPDPDPQPAPTAANQPEPAQPQPAPEREFQPAPAPAPTPPPATSGGGSEFGP